MATLQPTAKNNLLKPEDIGPNTFVPLFDRPPEPKEKVITERGVYHPRNTLNHLTGKEWIHYTRSWFVLKPRPRNKRIGEDLHPAKFPEELMERLIRFFTKKGMWILDPFCGTGSALLAAENLERNAVGFEIEPKWAEIAARRTRQYIIIGDCALMVKMPLPKFDFCVSSPPYWDMLRHSRGNSESTQKERIAKGYDAYFSDRPEDLGNITDYNEFLSKLLDIYSIILKKMRKGAYCVVIMQNIQKEKQKFYPLAWEFALGMRDRGWKLCQEMIWCQEDKKLGIWGYPSTYISNVHHHYCLVFRVPPESR